MVCNKLNYPGNVSGRNGGSMNRRRKMEDTAEKQTGRKRKGKREERQETENTGGFGGAVGLGVHATRTKINRKERRPREKKRNA